MTMIRDPDRYSRALLRAPFVDRRAATTFLGACTILALALLAEVAHERWDAINAALAGVLP